jgi:TIR domain
MPGVFICYRRADTGRDPEKPNQRFDAETVYEKLKSHFVKSPIFYDTHYSGIGEFPKALAENLESSDVVLVLIGPEWLKGRLIHKEKDWVHREISTAITRDKPILPVVFPCATFPKERDLPPDIHRLVFWPAIWLETDNGLELLIRKIEQYIEPPWRMLLRLTTWPIVLLLLAYGALNFLAPSANDLFKFYAFLAIPAPFSAYRVVKSNYVFWRELSIGFVLISSSPLMSIIRWAITGEFISTDPTTCMAQIIFHVQAAFTIFIGHLFGGGVGAIEQRRRLRRATKDFTE